MREKSRKSAMFQVVGMAGADNLQEKPFVSTEWDSAFGAGIDKI